MAAENKEKTTRWHRLLGKLLEEVLTPVGIAVFTDFPVMSEPPKSDILLLRNNKKEWTSEQKARLADGIRDCRATHILLEFKYTESVNKKAILQTICYDHLYKQTKKLADKDARTFLVSSKTQAKKTLTKFGFMPSALPGMFRSDNVLLKSIPLISLNDLADTPHNAFFKVFAGRQREKRISFYSLMNNMAVSSNPEIRWLVEGLANFWIYCKGENMEDELTPEKAKELGKRFHNALISTLSVEELLAGVAPEEIFEKYGKRRLVAKLKPEDLAGLKPEDRLAGLKPEDRLAGLSVEELETYLKKLKKMKK